MNLKLLFFANLCERLECSTLNVKVEHNATVAEVCQILADKGGRWQELFDNSSTSVIIAVNQVIAPLTTRLEENDEVAFFPSVTGIGGKLRQWNDLIVH